MTDLNRLFAATKQAFDLPKGVIYLDGNSLGPMTHASRARLVDEMDNQWSQKLIRGWNESGWYHLSQTVGDKIAALIGAPKGTVTTADNTSINVHKVLSAALAMNPGRKVILSDSGNFPTDLYVAQGVIAGLDDGYELKVVTPEQVFDAIDESVAVVMITQVDYCTGRLHDMASITERARVKGVKTIWDLCHSAGAMAIQLDDLKVDFAVGCGYKYFNGGPGAPAFLYVREQHINNIQPVLTGWMGHESPFSFDRQYTPMQGIGRMRVGTPSVLGLASLDAALDVWQGVTMQQVRARSIELSELFMDEVAKRCPELELASPTDASQRGSQVSYRFHEGYAVVQALIDQGVVGDFRMPNIVRFGITPLYLDEADIIKAAEIIGDVMTNKRWDCDKFKAVQAVT
ncbi:MAG: kynureninase [Pseudomonadales bacterium]|nr:kynureninase [Pseudomonadales bacterium]NRA16237.1 kynureninase [Oceanospirillaceae bacterium]